MKCRSDCLTLDICVKPKERCEDCDKSPRIDAQQAPNWELPEIKSVKVRSAPFKPRTPQNFDHLLRKCASGRLSRQAANWRTNCDGVDERAAGCDVRQRKIHLQAAEVEDMKS